ncbi:glutamine ABC transporter [Mesoplasma florum L1]|uniref:Glutamine ABC transporter n=1 Tax=Mesoplasma florum (strain ATCC 33453 / NBRC 100688 / NCTC 11704 / L1) TaxID=265311 RepID=Q6F298_MESFL|nr:ABC transporter ATP-binding protein [Mesoplasma florum]AAT75375.1 glutamine ABC transporter [Mesoplasma florum L1]
MANNKKNTNTNTWSKATNTKAVNAQKANQVKNESAHNKEIVDKYKEAINSTNKNSKQPTKKVVEPKTSTVVANSNTKKPLSKSEEKLINKINEKELIKQKIAEDKKLKKQNKAEAKRIYQEQIKQEKNRILLEKQEKDLKQIQEAEAKAKKMEAERIADAKKLALEEKAAKQAEKAQAKKMEAERIALEKKAAAEKAKAEKQAEAERIAAAKKLALEEKEREKLIEAQKLIEEKKAAENAKKIEDEKIQKELKTKAEFEAKQKETENKKIAKEERTNMGQTQTEKTPKVGKNSKTSEAREIQVFEPTAESEAKREFIEIDPKTNFDKGVKGLKQKNKYQKQLTSKYSKDILSEGTIVTTTNCKPNTLEHIIELKDVRKSYITGDLETPILKGIDVKLDKGDFIVILGPSGSGKTTFLNVISGLDKATEGDVFILGSNLSLLKDSHLTKFRRRNVGFIFQQYNLLTNLTSKENAEVGQNLANKNKQGMSIEEIFETIGMKEQMNKYPHQMSGGQQQRVSIARALAKNPEILFADEPTGALDEEMGRKVLEILVKVNREQKTTVVVVTHNPNIAKIANTVIHIKNGLIDSLEKNSKPADPKTIEWS